MSFGRIKSHIKSRHQDITLDEYLNLHYKTLPLHNPCIICNKKVVYKYQTCSKGCQAILFSSKTKGVPKPEGFMTQEHKNKISKYMIGKPGRFTGCKHSEKVIEEIRSRIKGKKLHLGFKNSLETKDKMSKSQTLAFKNGKIHGMKGKKLSLETIKKIFANRKINKLEQTVYNLLKQNNINFIHQFYTHDKGKCKIYDFKISNTNILLEIDGDYYHGHPRLLKHTWNIDEVRENDKIKDKLALDKGYNLIRIWESDIKKDPNIILDKLKEANVSI